MLEIIFIDILLCSKGQTRQGQKYERKYSHIS